MSASGPLARKTSVSSSSKSRAMANTTQEVTMTPPAVMRYFDPCAATAGMFLYAQGNSVVCCHHDTLTIERRFSRHDEEVQLLAVDTQSERGAGRLVVSYDAGSTAIVWDIMSGDEIARFSSYEHLTAAIWMKNGNVAFGNTQGNIILFEPETSEHISSRTLDQIAVTALAPAADCRTFAIGYQNGSLLICNLQPRFTILHNLTTSRGPSSIVNLAWHASSSRQKSDMLAVQTNDGDLRVWSVSKAYNNADPAKVVRILKRTENYLTGPNWMGWSKNGRIIQYSESETMSWDVRTKHVTFDSIPTLEHVRGLAVYGPGASLFTLGANNTVQQFDLNAPAVLVANAQHPANLLPPSPPVSIEEQDKAAAASNSESEISIGLEGVSESDDDHMSPIARMIQTKQHVDADQDFYGQPASEASSKSRKSSVSSASSRTPGRYQESIRSRGLTENTYISAGSSLRSPAASRYDSRNQDAHSISSLSSVSMGSSNHRSRHRPSRLRNEVPRSPEDNKVHDLFKFTKSRLHDLPYKHVPLPDSGKMTNEDLRRQMLSTIFGWNKDVEDLIRDEMSRHPNGSPNRVLLAKWLGDIESDIMTTSSQSMTSADWMRLALNGIGSQTSQQKLGRAFIQRLLEAGDIHAAVTMMLGMGDHNDAIEAYVSHKLYMEALLLCCLLFPAVWERQSQIVKKWGEWAAQHSQKQLAIRCFACSGKESSEPWTSPSAAQITFQSMTPSIPEVLSPPLSPPGIQRGPQRSIAKSSALKLITSFGDQNSRSKYFSGNEDGQTPIAAGVTPIAESAISPGAFADPATAFIRPGTRSALNTPSSARPSGPAAGFNRQRLPSIGEAPGDTPRGRLKASDLPTPPVDSLDKMSRGHAPKRSHDETSFSTGMSIGRAATASPMMMREGPRVRKEHPPPSPSPASMAALMEGRTSRNGPRNRIPRGIEMHVDTIEALDQSDITSPEQSVASSTRFHWPSRRRGPGSVGGSSVTSGASSLARSHRGRHPGRSLDDYIHSLDAAKNKKRGNSREGGSAVRDSSRSRRGDSRERSADRGRTSSRAYTPKAGKRSPRSPVPMSPEDLINLSTPKLADLEAHGNLLIDVGAEEPSTVRKASTVRHVSSNRVGSRASSRGSRRRSPERRPPALDIPRGRGNSRESSAIRSPSSPLPMSSQALHYQGSEDEEDYRKAVEEQEKFRSRNNRSTSRNVREPSPGMGRSGRDRSQSRRGTKERDSPENRTRTPAITTPAAVSVGDLRQTKDIRTLKKEAAARELEERRKSLARRPLAPPIVHPDELSPAFFRTTDTMELPSSTFVPPKDLPVRSRTAEPGQTRSMYANRGPPIGLPATPKAMRLIMETDPNAVPGVPTIPATFAQRHSPTSPANNSSPDKSPKKEAAAPPSLTLLPSTVYSPPVRPPISRCMSAPPEEPVPPKALQGGGGAPGAKTSSMQRRRSLRKLSTDTSVPTVRNIDGVMDTSRMARRQSRDDQIPPPPPPPPMLKELAHLATPPPPPPAPLPFGQKPAVYGGHASGTIEIVMEDGQTQPIPPPPPPPAVPVAIPVSEASVPIIAAPAPPSSRNGHHRGRSSIDNSIAGRISRATERMRSASRGRHNSSVISRTKSPEGMPAPYESVPPPVSYRAPPELRSPIQPLPVNDFRTGLHQSEMI